jgi:hypothetical protein
MLAELPCPWLPESQEAAMLAELPCPWLPESSQSC